MSYWPYMLILSIYSFFAMGVGSVLAEESDYDMSIPVEKVIIGLEREDSRGRYEAAEHLSRYETGKAVAAVPALIKTLKDRDAGVRACSAFALGNIGPKAKEAIPALKRALSDKIVNVQLCSSVALVSIGSNAKILRDKLTILVNSKSENIRMRAAIVLSKIDPEAALPVLLSLLKVSGTNGQVIYALGEIGPAAKMALPAFEKILKTERGFLVLPLIRDAIKKIKRNESNRANKNNSVNKNDPRNDMKDNAAREAVPEQETLTPKTDKGKPKD